MSAWTVLNWVREGHNTWVDHFLVRDTSGNINQPATAERLPRSAVRAAQMLGVWFGGQLRWAEASDQWLAWNGSAFERVDTAEVKAMLHDFGSVVATVLEHVKVDEIRAGSVANDPQTMEQSIATYEARWKRWRLFRDKLHDSALQRNVLTELATVTHVNESLLDTCEDVFVLENGVLDLQLLADGREPSECLLPHDPSRLVTRLASCRLVPGLGWDARPDGVATMWAWYLESVLPDPEVRAYLQRWIGSAMTGKPVSKGFLNLIGLGDSGKSSFLNAIKAVFGSYHVIANASVFAEKRPGDPNFEAHKLMGARLVLASEPAQGKRLDDELIKLYTGRDDLSTAKKYGDHVTWKAAGVLLLTSNHPMKFDTSDGAMMRRIKPIPFPHRIPVAQQIEGMDELLAAEREHVLWWCLEGLQAYLREGLGPEPAAVSRERMILAEEIDTPREWLREMLEAGQLRLDEHTAVTHCVGMAEAHTAYRIWCGAMDYEPVKPRRFNKLIAEFEGVEKRLSGERVFAGLIKTSRWMTVRDGQ